LSVPLDEQLGIVPYQAHSEEVVRLGCLFSVIMPYATASWLLGQWSGLSVSASSLWNWVQQYGASAATALTAQLQAQAEGQPITPEVLTQVLLDLPLAIAADGVMVPFRPVAQSAKGKTVWREVKVGIFARLGQRLTQAGKQVPELLQRRLVAILGDIDQFIPLMNLEAQYQSLHTAPKVVWLSDGGRGYWRVFRTCFGHCAIPILDFYHAAGHLWRATAALFDDAPQSSAAKAWFRRWRHQLRHGQHHQVLKSLTILINTNLFAGKAFTTVLQVQAYFQRHHRHIRYQHFAQQQLPLGSGMVESACKWLIQQRFKGVGMRWSESGFNHLLLLRLAWANHRFDDLFPAIPAAKQKYSIIP
jgi:hypothetical protein